MSAMTIERTDIDPAGELADELTVQELISQGNEIYAESSAGSARSPSSAAPSSAPASRPDGPISPRGAHPDTGPGAHRAPLRGLAERVRPDPQQTGGDD